MTAAHPAALHLVPVEQADNEYGEPAELVEFRGDITDRPALDPEAQVLCALLLAPSAIAKTVTAHLQADDFYRSAYAELYELVAGLVDAGRSHSAALVLAELEQTGRMGGDLSRLLPIVITANAYPEDVGRLAHAVIAQAYRRGYVIAADRLRQHATDTDVEDLFEQMCALGRERRDAKTRLDAAAEVLL